MVNNRVRFRAAREVLGVLGGQVKLQDQSESRKSGNKCFRV